MGYWDRTDRYLDEHGGHGPTCLFCGEEMFAEDDHGRFRCLCGGRAGTDDHGSVSPMPKPKPIPQVNTQGMSNEEKARIPAIHRLHDKPTEAEAKLMQVMTDPDCIGSPKYQEVVQALEQERGQNDEESE